MTMILPGYAKAGLAALVIGGALAVMPPAQTQTQTFGDELLFALLVDATPVAQWD